MAPFLDDEIEDGWDRDDAPADLLVNLMARLGRRVHDLNAGKPPEFVIARLRTDLEDLDYVILRLRRESDG